MEHLLVITEDILQRMLDTEGITSSGWLPATAQAQHAAQFNSASVSGGSVAGSIAPSVAGSVAASRRSSVQPPEWVADSSLFPSPFQTSLTDLGSRHVLSDPPHSMMNLQLWQKPNLVRNHSDSFHHSPQLLQHHAVIPRTNSDVIAHPKPVPVGQFNGHRHGRVQWNLGSEG
jgi:hypothetical protein